MQVNHRKQVWKARLSAYNAIITAATKTIDEDDQFFSQPFLAGSSIREWVRDANAVAQDKGVEAACKVIEMGGKSLSRSVVSSPSPSSFSRSQLTKCSSFAEQNKARSRSERRREMLGLGEGECIAQPARTRIAQPAILNTFLVRE